MGFFSRKRRSKQAEPAAPVQRISIDRGVPDLQRPVHAVVHVLDEEWVDDATGRLTVDVEPVGSPPWRDTLFFDRRPDLVEGVVQGYSVPGLVDLDHPEHLVLLEPPGGVDLPRVEADLAQARVERDARTAELLRRYPVPAVARLRALLTPGTQVGAAQAARFRASLITLQEAQAVVRLAQDQGEVWKRASGRLQGLRRMDHEVLKDAAECFSHVGHVAPGGRDLDEQVLMNLLLTIKQVEESGLSTQDQALVPVVLGPWEQVLGPVF